jgi:hypothetical protein
MRKKENKMRIFVVAALMLTATGAMANEIDDAHRQAITGRDTYWNCLAQEYQAYAQGSSKAMSGPDFTSHIADVCASERQNFRVSLVDYLSRQFPDVDAGDHMTTANKAIALAQKDIVTAFIKHKEASK